MAIQNKIYFINRKTGGLEEELIYCETTLRFLYGSSLGKSLGALIAKLSFFSKIAGWWERLPLTKRRIAPFVEKYKIDLSECELSIEQYPSFDAFFTRRLKKEARPLGEGVIIPADGRYLFYQNIEKCDGFIIKNKKFTLEKLLGDATLAKRYARGSMAIARLAPCDYHRFHFPISCIPSLSKRINGPLYSVNPIAVKQNIELLSENKRVLTQLKTENYGNIFFIEIGATNVGSIHQTYLPDLHYKKGEEKGFFSFGGSSIIMLFEEGRVKFAADLLHNSLQHIETLCRFGQPLERMS